MGGWTAAVREWWEQWERVVAGAVAALVVLGLGLVFAGVVPIGDTARADPAWPPTGPLTSGPPTSGPAVLESLAVQPGGPAVGSPTEDRVVHAFGPVPVGSTSTPLVLVVTNNLAYAVEVRAVAMRSASFTIRDDACTTAVLQPRTTCRLSMAFAPTSPGDARSPVALRLRQVCAAPVHWPCSAGESQIRTGVPDGSRTVLPSGQAAVDWTTGLGDGLSSLWVEGTTG